MMQTGNPTLTARSGRMAYLLAAAAWPLPIYAIAAWGQAVYGFEFSNHAYETAAEEASVLLAKVCMIVIEIYLVSKVVTMKAPSISRSFRRLGRIHARIFFGVVFAIWSPVQIFVRSLDDEFGFNRLQKDAALDSVAAGINQIVFVFITLAFLLGFFLYGVTLLEGVPKAIRSFCRHPETSEEKSPQE